MMGVPETWAASRTLAHVSKIEGTLEMQHSRLMQGSANFCQGPERKHLTAFTFRIQNEGWDDKIKGRCFFLFVCFLSKEKRQLK